MTRAQEKKLEARRTPHLGGSNEEGDEEEMVDEEEEEGSGDTNATTPDPESQVDLHPGTQAEIALAKMWPMRYLGIHCRVEDALQYDDRAIYPRASSRLGPRHQANVNVWHGHAVEFVKPAEIKKRYVKAAGNKKEGKLSKETVAAIEADKAEKAKRPKWVMDEPPGYVRRGEDLPNKDSKCTAELMFKMPPLGVHSTRGEDNAPTVTEEQVKAYMERARALAKPHVGVEPYNTNFLDKCLALFTKHQYDADVALKHVKKLDKRKDLKEPELTKEEEKKWNDGVTKYGSEIRNVRLHTSKTMFYGDAVRYYYMWKKTAKGKEIWGSYSNRKGRTKKVEPDAQSRLVDDIADNQDDSAFDNDKAIHRKRHFQCKFCTTRHSRQWRRAPGVSPGQVIPADGRSKDKTGFVVALCLRCANLWRKYAVKWENVDEIAKKVAQGGGKAWKRRIDEELLREVYAAQTESSSMNGTPEYTDMPTATAQPVEPPKKKQKTAAATNGDSGASTPVNEPASKKKEKERPAPIPKAPTPPPVPSQPRLRNLPCAVCRSAEGSRLECAACRLTVHKSCYGIEDIRQANKWYCDTCKNDKKESVSYVSSCSILLDQWLTICRPTSVFSVRSMIWNRSSMSSLKYRTRRKPTGIERRSEWRRSSSTRLKRNTVSSSKRKADRSFPASRSNVPLTTTGCTFIARFGIPKLNSATQLASTW
ncbi:putative PHD type zinc finger protein with BAH domain-containing protein [Neocucurbitaria cava]|uniref:PHD type zinc finger protein with BAH domain-containing protein n=1 Tax=Neocucurbitaria cava TaxID=798079 RepID=A0A9W8YB81_9PLEO|nr:putative PHD type zinc finger protein with BAH domain-containing protein [Neocucurbitaria cava]